jgi:hypothetical protein
MFVRGTGPLSKDKNLIKTNGALAWSIPVTARLVQELQDDETGNVFFLLADQTKETAEVLPIQVGVLSKKDTLEVRCTEEQQGENGTKFVPVSALTKMSDEQELNTTTMISVPVENQYDIYELFETFQDDEGNKKFMGYGDDIASQAYLYARDQIKARILPEYQNWLVGVNDTALPGLLQNIRIKEAGFAEANALLSILLRNSNSKESKGHEDSEWSHLVPFGEYKAIKNAIESKYEAAEYTRAWKLTWNTAIDGLIISLNEKGLDGVRIFGLLCLHRAMTNNVIENEAKFGAHAAVTVRVKDMEFYTTFHYCAAIMSPRIAEFLVKYKGIRNEQAKAIDVKVKPEQVALLKPAMLKATREKNNKDKWSKSTLLYGELIVYRTELCVNHRLLGPDSMNTKMGVIWKADYVDTILAKDSSDVKEYIYRLTPVAKNTTEPEDFEDVDTIEEEGNFPAEDTDAFVEAFNDVYRNYMAEQAEAEGNHIFSGSDDGLLAALTNPTELAFSKGKLKNHYPITDKQGIVHADAEAAFQFYKDKSEAINKPSMEESKNYKLMVAILDAKLKQHPRLVESMKKRANSCGFTVDEYLEICYHQPTSKNTVWETNGQNWFMTALREAFYEHFTE